VSDTSKLPRFHIRTPGAVVADGVHSLLTSPALTGTTPPRIPGVDTHNPAQLARLRRLQADGVGSVIDLLIAGGLVGTGVGYLRHRKKISDTREELDAARDAGSGHRVGIKTSGFLGTAAKAIGRILVLPVDVVRSIVKGTGTVDLHAANKYDVPLGVLPKGWAIPAVALGVPAMALASERLMDTVTDKERQRILDARKQKLEAQFDELLATPVEKTAEAGSACAELLNFVAPRAAIMLKASSVPETSTLLRGGVMAWWILSGILAYNAGAAYSRRRDPNYQGQKALKEFEAEEKSRTPMSIRVSRRGPQRLSSIPSGVPVTVGFPGETPYIPAGFPLPDPFAKEASVFIPFDPMMKDVYTPEELANKKPLHRHIIDGARAIGDTWRGAKTLIGTARDIGRNQREGMSGTESMVHAVADRGGLDGESLMHTIRLGEAIGGVGDADPENIAEALRTANRVGGVVRGMHGVADKAQTAIQSAYPTAISFFSGAKDTTGTDVQQLNSSVQSFVDGMSALPAPKTGKNAPAVTASTSRTVTSPPDKLTEDQQKLFDASRVPGA